METFHHPFALAFLQVHRVQVLHCQRLEEMAHDIPLSHTVSFSHSVLFYVAKYPMQQHAIMRVMCFSMFDDP